MNGGQWLTDNHIQRRPWEKDEDEVGAVKNAHGTAFEGKRETPAQLATKVQSLSRGLPSSPRGLWHSLQRLAVCRSLHVRRVSGCQKFGRARQPDSPKSPTDVNGEGRKEAAAATRKPDIELQRLQRVLVWLAGQSGEVLLGVQRRKESFGQQMAAMPVPAPAHPTYDVRRARIFRIFIFYIFILLLFTSNKTAASVRDRLC